MRFFDWLAELFFPDLTPSPAFYIFAITVYLTVFGVSGYVVTHLLRKYW